MKRLFTLFAACCSISLIAQTELNLQMTHWFDGQEYVEFTNFTTADGYDVDFSRMEYYLCDFVITHDGGQQTALTETYVLVNAHTNGTYPLGSWDGIQSIEAISFAVGVDEANNHEDPAAWPADHPLAPTMPSMHWGWSSGYRFLAYEGSAGANNVEIHALGDDNFFSQSHDVSVEAASGIATISLNADYAPLFNNLDVSNGLIEHSTTGAAITALENFRDFVFSAGSANNTEEATAAALTMYPNPASEVVNVAGALGHSIVVLDLTGREVAQLSAVNGSAEIRVDEWPAGVYLARISHNGKAVRTERLVIR